MKEKAGVEEDEEELFEGENSDGVTSGETHGREQR